MASLWIFLSLFSAFSLATSDAFTKKALETCNEYLVAWFRLLFSLPILFALLIFLPRPQLDREFFLAFIIALPLEIISVILYIKALRLSPLSLTLPFLSLTPVFVIAASYGILGEEIPPRGLTGILLLAGGSYILHMHEFQNGILDPIKAVFREKGSVLMMLVALIYSVTSSFGKMAVIHSSPLFFGATYVLCLTVFFAPVAICKGRREMNKFIMQKQYRGVIVPGMFYGSMVASHMMAISLTNVAYMIALKRTSVLIGILYGYFLFRESHIRERFVGAIIMVAGFMLIVVAQ